MSATKYKTEDLANAEVVPNSGGPNAWLVRFGEENYDLVGKNAKNQLILQDGVFDNDTFKFGGVTVNVDFDMENYSLERDGVVTQVPVNKHEHVLWSIHDEDGDRLNKLFDEFNVPRVRIGMMDMLMPLLRDSGADIHKSDDGWVIGRDILLSWDASNHPVNVQETHVVSGGTTVAADVDKQARNFQFSLADEATVELPNGTSTELRNVEQEFLISAAIIADADTGGFPSAVQQAVEDSAITAFTDTKSGLHHSHSMDKHTLGMVGVTEDASSRLWYNDYDHAGVHELYERRDEFQNADTATFKNASNSSARKWEQIDKVRRAAPIPKSVKQDLKQRY
jgi:hypothetical protein